jgi:ribose transport system permease protein
LRQEQIRRIVSIGLLALLIVILSLTSDTFLTTKNILTLLRESSTMGIVAIGVTFVIITAGIDLSTGALIGCVSMICANLMYNKGFSGTSIIFISIILGTFGGFINGMFVSRLHLPDFIATLSSQFIFRGLALVFAIKTSTGMISNKVIDDRTIMLLGGNINGVYISIIAFFVLVLIGQFILKRTKFGLYTYSIGSNNKSSQLSGINSANIKLGVYTLTGFLCGIAALFLMGKMKSVTPDTGLGLEFDIIAAVVVGGCAFNGGRGDVFGTMIGVIFMSALTNGIYKYNFPTAIQLMLTGSVIVAMVIFDSVYNSYMTKKMTQKKNNEVVA